MKSIYNDYEDEIGNRIFIGESSSFLNSSLDFTERDAILSIGKKTRIKNCSIRIGRGSSLTIGDNCTIDGRVFIGAYSNVHIGSDFTVTGNIYIRAVESTNIYIGNDVIAASNVTIRTNDGHTIHDLTTGDRINESLDVKIEDHVWLAEEVAVLKGVTIGEGSVIGMRSLVTKSVPKNSLACGIPSKVIKDKITWKR
ncbi:acyltransferase [Enterovibrio sp. 27052020O]|uniref:acyltransferase n=1 Tax=Enterovibrio sp. 27052020O TaxID=3241166 RepID=UPI00388D9415